LARTALARSGGRVGKLVNRILRLSGMCIRVCSPLRLRSFLRLLFPLGQLLQRTRDNEDLRTSDTRARQHRVSKRKQLASQDGEAYHFALAVADQADAGAVFDGEWAGWIAKRDALAPATVGAGDRAAPTRHLLQTQEHDGRIRHGKMEKRSKQALTSSRLPLNTPVG
jgi:hypothetical protein